MNVERWRSGNSVELSESVRNSIRFAGGVGDYDNKYYMMCTMSILTETVSQVRWPANWIEGFKERWFPTWLKKYYPVIYSTVDIKAIYPKSSLPDPILKGVENIAT